MLRVASETRAASELRRLLPALRPLLSASPPTAARVIAATAHFTALPHRADCPVQQRAMALSAIADDAAFLARPCAHCAARRAHFLACEDFSAFVSRRCAAGPTAMPPALAAAVCAQFGSRAALESALIAAAAGRGAPGLAWLCCGSACGSSRPAAATATGGPTALRLAVVAPPPGRVPLVDGQWPLAAVDASSPRRVLSAAAVLLPGLGLGTGVGTGVGLGVGTGVGVGIGGEAAAAGERAQRPKWSRAARNAAAAAAIASPPALGAPLGGSLAAVRLRLAQDAVAAMNWDFVHEQWSAAAAYFESPARAELVQARRAELEREAALAAMSRLRDSGATILTSDTVEIATKPTDEETATTATTTTTTANTTTTTATAKTEGDAADPECAQLPDGTWEYKYRSGDVTLLRPDGTRVFKRPDLTTTVYATGGTLFEYPNGTSIFDRPDGVRVTTFADGTTNEERIQ